MTINKHNLINGINEYSLLENGEYIQQPISDDHSCNIIFGSLCEILNYENCLIPTLIDAIQIITILIIGQIYNTKENILIIKLILIFLGLNLLFQCVGRNQFNLNIKCNYYLHLIFVIYFIITTIFLIYLLINGLIYKEIIYRYIIVLGISQILIILYKIYKYLLI